MIDLEGGAARKAAEEARRRAEEAQRAEQTRRTEQLARAAVERSVDALAVPADCCEKSTGAGIFSAPAAQQVGAQGTPVFDPRADIDGSGDIDILDLTRIARQYDQRGPNLSGDIDGNERVDLLDLVRAAGSYGTRASTDWTDPLRPGFSVLNQMMTVFDDPLRGVHVKIEGPIGYPPFTGFPDPRDSHFVMKDGLGNPVLKGRVEAHDGRWSIILLQKDIPDSLLRSTSFDLSVYMQGDDGHWAMNQGQFDLSGNTLVDYINALIKK